jgi:hypothetical protein
MDSNVIRIAPALSETVRKAFTGYGCVTMLTELGCTIYLHVALETAMKYRAGRHTVQLGLCDVEGFPLVHLMIRFGVGDEDGLQVDRLLNVFDQHELGQLKAFTWQEEINFHWYDEGLKFVRSSVVVWSEKNRSEAGNILAIAQKMMETADRNGFGAASEWFLGLNS